MDDDQGKVGIGAINFEYSVHESVRHFESVEKLSDATHLNNPVLSLTPESVDLHFPGSH